MKWCRYSFIVSLEDLKRKYIDKDFELRFIENNEVDEGRLKSGKFHFLF